MRYLFRSYLAQRGLVRGLQAALIGSLLFSIGLMLGRLVWNGAGVAVSELIPALIMLCLFSLVAFLFSATPAILGATLLANWLHRGAVLETLSLKGIFLKGALIGGIFGLGTSLLVLWISSWIKVHNGALISSPQSLYAFLSYVLVAILCAACSGVWAGVQLSKDLKQGFQYGYLDMP